jgi:hypothetical protein
MQKVKNPVKNPVKNIGPVSWVALKKAGIADSETLRQVGAVNAYVAVSQIQPGVTLNFLYALAAGLRDCHWQDVCHEEKGRLQREVDDLRETL